VRINVKTLPDGSVSAYGFYTGGKKDWEFVPVIKAKQQGEKFVADIGNGIGLTWTPAANPDDAPRVPALEGAPPLPTIWVYPPTEQSNKILVNPEHPPDYQDAIIWFPADTGLEPISHRGWLVEQKSCSHRKTLWERACSRMTAKQSRFQRLDLTRQQLHKRLGHRRLHHAERVGFA
jgi:hypothetical protein